MARKVLIEMTLAEAEAMATASNAATGGLDEGEMLDTFHHPSTIRAYHRADRKLWRAILTAKGQAVVDWDGSSERT